MCFLALSWPFDLCHGDSVWIGSLKGLRSDKSFASPTQRAWFMQEKVSRRRDDNVVPVANHTEPKSKSWCNTRRPRTRPSFFFSFQRSCCKVRRLDRRTFFFKRSPSRVKTVFPTCFFFFLPRRDVRVSDGADCEREVTLTLATPTSRSSPRAFPHRAEGKWFHLENSLRRAVAVERSRRWMGSRSFRARLKNRRIKFDFVPLKTRLDAIRLYDLTHFTLTHQRTPLNFNGGFNGGEFFFFFWGSKAASE